MPAKATEVFNEYMEFLEIKSEELEDFSVHDEGGQALYYLLVKLMGDNRILGSDSCEYLYEFNFPPVYEIADAGKKGDYSKVIELLIDDCELKDNGAKPEINSEIIEILESLVPSLIDFITWDWDKYRRVDPSYLNSLL
jgi:hypothetical protein